MASTVESLWHGATTWEGAKKRRLVDGSTPDQALPERTKLGYTGDASARPTTGLRDVLPRLQPSAILPPTAPGPGIYTQRKLRSSTPGATQNPVLSLSHPHYGLPPRLVANLQALGIHSIYPWQSSCLLGKGNLTGKQNLVYTAPTGGGKSLVADLLIMRRVLERKKAVLVLPYVSLVQEKLRWLRRALDGVDRPPDASADEEWRARPGRARDHTAIRIAGFHGGVRTHESWADIDLAVCTLEKASLRERGYPPS